MNAPGRSHPRPLPARRPTRIVAVGVWAIGAGLLASCATQKARPHPEDVRKLVSAAPPKQPPRFEPLSAAERKPLQIEAPEPYRIGRGDILNIQGDQFRGFGETTKGYIAGTKVKPDGQLYLPDLAPIEAAGRTVIEVQDAIREALKRFNKQPFVSVDVLTYVSQKYFILGEVMQPGVAPVDGETSLIEALAKAGGFSKLADVEQAFVVRAQKILPVSLADIVRRGDLNQNVILKDKDLIFVPSLKVRRVFVLGEVYEQGVFPLPEEGMTLVEAVALAGGMKAEFADVNQVRVFRGGWCNPEAFTISANELFAYGESIRLFPGDRVYIAPTEQASYARALQLVAPFVSAALNTITTTLVVTDRLNK
jgi:polysaccharide export outer membrane protein